MTFTFFGVKFSFNVMKVEGGNGNESAACKYYCADLQRGKSIERCLRSIQNQSYQNIEVLVVNDGSTDHTDRVIRRYAEGDKRFHYIKKETAEYLTAEILPCRKRRENISSLWMEMTGW